MTNKKAFSPPKAPEAVGPYNLGVRLGNLLFSSGQIPLDPETNQLVQGDIVTQAERIFENIRIILEDQGLTFDHVVKTTAYLTDLKDFQKVNEVYARYFSEDFPARSAVQVSALPKGANLEIEFIAHYPET